MACMSPVGSIFRAHCSMRPIRWEEEEEEGGDEEEEEEDGEEEGGDI